MTIRLHQFAISHYCEKVRWALDYKGLSYQSHYLLPGSHIKTIRRMAGKTSVPVLEHDGHAVQGSSAILDYLDTTFPERPLTPDDPATREQARAWEQKLDDEAGPAIRCYAYHHMLQRPKVVAPLLAAQTPFYNRYLLRLAFSRVDEVMRQWMKINEKTAERSRETMETVATELNNAYQQSAFLAGDHFSRADLTAAALFSPLFMPEQYPVPWPDRKAMPKPMTHWLDTWEDTLEPLRKIYQQHR